MIEFIDLNNSCIRGYQLKAVLSILRKTPLLRGAGGVFIS